MTGTAPRRPGGDLPILELMTQHPLYERFELEREEQSAPPGDPAADPDDRVTPPAARRTARSRSRRTPGIAGPCRPR